MHMSTDQIHNVYQYADNVTGGTYEGIMQTNTLPLLSPRQQL